jgi:pimeloyl-ACP methyl ester carboxylesterase
VPWTDVMREASVVAGVYGAQLPDIDDPRAQTVRRTTTGDAARPAVAARPLALVLVGDHDFIRVADAVEAAELPLHGQLAVLPGTTHMDMTRSPDRVLAMVVPFLDA